MTLICSTDFAWQTRCCRNGTCMRVINLDSRIFATATVSTMVSAGCPILAKLRVDKNDVRIIIKRLKTISILTQLHQVLQ